jgi:hypothetical protein
MLPHDITVLQFVQQMNVKCTSVTEGHSHEGVPLLWKYVGTYLHTDLTVGHRLFRHFREKIPPQKVQLTHCKSMIDEITSLPSVTWGGNTPTALHSLLQG